MVKKKDENEAAFDAGVDTPDRPAPQATATSGTVTAPPGKPVGAGDLGVVIEKLRHVIADLQAGNMMHAWGDVWAILDEFRAAFAPSPAPLMRGVDDANASTNAALKAHAQRLEEFIQHAEGGTNHPVSRAAAVGDSHSWIQLLLPILMQILTDLLRRRTTP